MLIPARTDTRAFHKYIYGKAEIRFLKGRVKFEGGAEHSTFPEYDCNIQGRGARMILIYLMGCLTGGFVTLIILEFLFEWKEAHNMHPDTVIEALEAMIKILDSRYHSLCPDEQRQLREARETLKAAKEAGE
jgi:hypothetical protein